MTGRPRIAAWLAVGLTLALAAGCQAGPQPHQASASSPASGAASPSSGSSCGTSAAASPPGLPVGGPTAAARPVLTAVQFVSASAGWAIGSDRILHTADGGAHWAVQFQAGRRARLAAIDFADARHGWVVGASTVLATADGGAHWRALPEPCEPVRLVHFFSPSDGVAVAGGSLTYLGAPAGDGVLLGTADGGRRWRRIPAPPDVQTACFSNADRGWLGADGNIYGTANGGRTWTLAVRGPGTPGGPPGVNATAEVECAGSGAAWAEVVGPGAATSHVPQLGYHTFGVAWQPIFAEQFFPHPGVRVRTDAPSVEPGPFSAISQHQAVFIGFCAPCSPPATPNAQGIAPMDIATDGGAVLLRRGPIARLAEARGAAFVTADDGWVVGTQTTYPPSRGGRSSTVSRIMHTADGGRSWQVQYALGP